MSTVPDMGYVRPEDMPQWVRDHPAEAITLAIRIGIDIGRNAAYEEMFAAVRQAMAGNVPRLVDQVEAAQIRRIWDLNAATPRHDDYRGWRSAPQPRGKAA